MENQIDSHIVQEKQENEINKMLKAKYNYKLNYTFKKAQNFEYKFDIANLNEHYGINDILN